MFTRASLPLVRLGVIRDVVGESGDEVTGSCLELSPPLLSRYLTDRPVLDDRVRVYVARYTSRA